MICCVLEGDNEYLHNVEEQYFIKLHNRWKVTQSRKAMKKVKINLKIRKVRKKMVNLQQNPSFQIKKTNVDARKPKKEKVKL